MAAEIDDSTIANLIEISKDMKAKAYCPYTRVRVGAALLCNDNTIFTGCNVENASCGLTICAERTALVKAVADGHRKFKAIAISSDDADTWISPCGACRQFLVEFGTDCIVYMTKNDMSYLGVPLKDLLPYSFGPENFHRLQQ